MFLVAVHEHGGVALLSLSDVLETCIPFYISAVLVQGNVSERTPTSNWI